MASLTIVLAGGSGFLGSHLRTALTGRGHTVTSLVRRETSAADESTWDPYAGQVDRTLVRTADVVINLAGSPTLGNPHSKKWAHELMESRVTTTRLLAETIAGAGSGRPPAYLAGNGISYYGDHGDAVLTEVSDTRGHALLTDVARAWQEAADPAVAAGSRVCVLRTAPVMDRRAAPLQQLRLLFKTGLGGKIGNGRQYMPMISLRDWVGGVVHLAEHDDASGAFNLCLPEAPTNAEFTKTLAAAVSRPAFVPVPAPLIKVAGGKMSSELLGSLNVRPAALLASGYVFEDADVDALIATALR
ncbi:TIGR01777 family oxidoreductase [Nocardioides sp.]|uniref:TIGR01777 family oxidoreductase n=1 Tax=Nocardioides sp. TaxID=35761 RepID=UPI00271C624E|nr:TIGR01777 family oxidoreductase [Nocardioides sp.]MDO9454485.1 TIGR01777 family oxidoreductase [Nocardioides sp.]